MNILRISTCHRHDDSGCHDVWARWIPRQLTDNTNRPVYGYLRVSCRHGQKNARCNELSQVMECGSLITNHGLNERLWSRNTLHLQRQKKTKSQTSAGTVMLLLFLLTGCYWNITVNQHYCYCSTYWNQSWSRRFATSAEVSCRRVLFCSTRRHSSTATSELSGSWNLNFSYTPIQFVYHVWSH